MSAGRTSLWYDRLRAELESGRNVNGAWLDEDAEALLDDATRLREALEWYAERRNYLPPGGAHHYDALVATDAWDSVGPGARARAALSKAGPTDG